MIEKLGMPVTTKEKVFFTLLTAWMMVYCMTLYNMASASGGLENSMFIKALGGMWIEYVLITLFALLVAGRFAPKLAFRVVEPGDRGIFIILAVQVFMSVIQVGFASIIGVVHAYGLNGDFIANYITVYCRNFLMALPLQLILVGPLARFIFRKIFRN